MTAIAEVTWKDVVAAEVGHIFLDKFDEGIRFIILRGPASLCAYVGIPAAHPLAGHSYDWLPVEAHGGLTYANEGGGEKGYLPAGFFWYGWDYGHCGDYAVYNDKYPEIKLSAMERSEKKWTPAEVEADSWGALYGFRSLLKLAEAIAAKGKRA